MNKKFINIALIISLALAWLAGNVVQQTPDYLSELNTFVNKHYDTNFVMERSGNPTVYKVTKQEQCKGYLALGEATGYEGKVITAVLINPEGTIVDTHLLEQNEWQQWITKITEAHYLEEFQGKKVSDQFIVDKDIEGVTGATITSRAIAGGVRKASHYIAKEYLDLQPEKAPVKWISLDILLLCFIWVLIIFGVVMKKTALRYITLLLGTVVVGFWLNTTVNFSQFGSIILGRFPSIDINLRWYIMILGVFFTTIFFRRNIYCFWLCPFGAIQELLFMATGRKSQTGNQTRLLFSIFRKIIVWICIIIILVLRRPSIVGFEPFIVMFSFTGSTLNWVFLFYTLTTGLYSFRFWCENMCPVGYLINALASSSRWLNNKIQTLSPKINLTKKPSTTA